MRDLILQYYTLLSGIFNAVSAPIRALIDTVNLPLVSALLLGLLGATAPCQLSTNVAALAFLTRGIQDARRVWGQTLAFVAGKVTIYMVVGGFIVVLGLQIDQITEAAIPVVIAARRGIGPLLIIVGLFMIGALTFRRSIGDRISSWLYAKLGRRQGIIPAYMLGATFAFTFCPTLFWLFFGLTVPLAITSPGGIVFPGVFALGTTLPIVALSFFALRAASTGQFLKRIKIANVWIQRAAGVIFILVGIHEIVLYWIV